MSNIKNCFICKKPTPNGVYNVKQNYVCRSCLDTYSNFYVDDFTIEDGEFKMKSPFEGMDEKEQRAVCIHYAYTLFDQKIASRSYRMVDSYRKKGMTWLGMIRALEWFYIVRKNDISKANESVGIIPHVYEDAQKYYKRANEIIEERYRKQILSNKELEVKVVEISKKEKGNKLDVGGL